MYSYVHVNHLSSLSVKFCCNFFFNEKPQLNQTDIRGQVLFLYSATQKSLHFFKVLNFTKYSQVIFIAMDSFGSLLSNETK